MIQTTRSTSIQSFCTKLLIRCHHHHIPPNPFTLLDTPLLREPTCLPPLALILYSDRTVQYRLQQDPATLLPAQYHKFPDIFSKDDADKLPPLHLQVDHKIKMEPGTQALSGPLYSMSREELEVLKKYLTENLNKGFIQASSSPAAAPVLFVKKPEGGLCFCVDYRALNTITIKNCYPLPLIQEMLDQLCKAVWYTKLDIVGAFNCIWMKEGEEWKTVFCARSGLYKYLVILFGLANTPSMFQNYINNVLGPDILDVFGTAYVDDILVYSQTLNEHQKHVKLVLS